MKRLVLFMLFFISLTLIFMPVKVMAQNYAGWRTVSLDRIGIAEHIGPGYAYIFVTDAEGNLFSSQAFYVKEKIRKEVLAMTLTALSLKQNLRIRIVDTPNEAGHQMVDVLYTLSY